MEKLFPECRGTTSAGRAGSQEIISFQIHEVPIRSKVIDWTIQEERNVLGGYMISPNGKKLIDFKNHNHYLIKYILPFLSEVKFVALQKHSYFREVLPKAIGYVASYYE